MLYVWEKPIMEVQIQIKALLLLRVDKELTFLWKRKFNLVRHHVHKIPVLSIEKIDGPNIIQLLDPDH
jgi:hypothetical protein